MQQWTIKGRDIDVSKKGSIQTCSWPSKGHAGLLRDVVRHGTTLFYILSATGAG